MSGCDMKGFLSFLVLRMISKRPMCGDEIRREIERRRGALPSAGTVYPVLKDLREKGLIEVTCTGRVKRYSITERGSAVVEAATRQFVILFQDLAEEFQLKK